MLQMTMNIDNDTSYYYEGKVIVRQFGITINT